MNIFHNKIAIVTGGASGIGKALCEELAKQGAVVIIADLDREKAEQVARAITATQSPAYPVTARYEVDVTQPEQVQRVVDETVAQHGRLDYIFNNAGIGILGEVIDMKLEHWNRIIDVNLRGVIHGISAAYPVMVRQGYGHIVNTSSGFGLVAMPTHVAYGTTKHALVGLSTGLRSEAAGLGVKVTVACPGIIRTPMAESTTFLRGKIEAKPPFKMMEAADCAKAILEGVAQNKAIITMPSYMTLTWWLHRLSPNLTALASRQMIASFRKNLK
ncbi:MAG: SDR family oxidoreductase [Chloroflexi bacterium]|nr:SDR family oxidoreductase [Chloroflexota bacterium]